MLFEHGLFLCLLLYGVCLYVEKTFATVTLVVPRNFTHHDFCQVAFSLCLVAYSLLPCAAKNYTEFNPIEQP